jgi:hypothetical protein
MAGSAAAALIDGGLSQAPRSGPPPWSKAAVAGVMVLSVALTVFMVCRELADIQILATEMQTAVLPQVTAQQRRAIWIENLRSAAQVVVYAPSRSTRQDALSKAEQLAANVTELERANDDVLTRAWTLIRRAAERTDEAERIEGEIRARLREADSLIVDMSANLGSIVEDSAGTLARLIREALNAGDQGGLTRQTLEEVLSINTTSQDLLASLDQGRILLAAARSMTEDGEIDGAAAHFHSIGRQLTLRVDTLRGNSDYEYLPAMIERFVGLAVIFQLRRDWLNARNEAVAASHQATVQLGLLRETLNADAADSAERSMASIITNLASIDRSVGAALVVLLLIGLLVAWHYRCVPAVTERADAGVERDQAQRADEVARAQVRATLASLEAFVTERANLEHLCRSLPVKLQQTASGVLEHIARAQQRCLAGAAAEASPPSRYCRPCSPCRPLAPAGSRQSPLPEDWSASGVIELVHEIAAASTTAALQALHESVRAIEGTERVEAPDGGAGHGRVQRPARSGDLALSLRSLELAADVAGSTTEQVNLALAEMNSLARRVEDAGEPPDAERVLAEINRKVDMLRDALGATRSMLSSQLSGTA